ncbi:MAG: rhodanese-like domain-containing protein [Oligoflexus sp.]
MYRIQAESLLRHLPIPFLEPILEEAFAQLWWQGGNLGLPRDLQTVADLASAIHWDSSKVCARLQRIYELSQNTCITVSHLKTMLAKTAEIVLLDLRRDEEYIASPLPGSLSISQFFLPEICQKWQRNNNPVVTIAKLDERAFSGCLYLKEMGLKEVYYLEGGDQAWQQDNSQA